MATVEQIYCCHSLNQNKILTQTKYALQNLERQMKQFGKSGLPLLEVMIGGSVKKLNVQHMAREHTV